MSELTFQVVSVIALYIVIITVIIISYRKGGVVHGRAIHSDNESRELFKTYEPSGGKKLRKYLEDAWE